MKLKTPWWCCRLASIGWERTPMMLLMNSFLGVWCAHVGISNKVKNIRGASQFHVAARSHPTNNKNTGTL